MKKSDLKSGMVVKFRYWNRLCMLIDNVFCEVDGSGFVNLSSYDEDMCNIKDGNQWDFKNCELIEEAKEDITYDNLVDEIREHCHKTKCLNCEHDNYNDCKYAYILENYNVTRKDI